LARVKRGRRRSRVRSREGFRFDPVPVPLRPSSARAFARSVGGLGARPRTLPNRVRWERSLLCAKHQLSTSATTRKKTREHDLERPILARFDGRAFPPASLRQPPLPVRSLSTSPGMRQPLSLERSGQRASPHQRRASRTGASLSELERRGPLLFATARARCRIESTVGCAEDGCCNGEMRFWADALGVKGPPPLRRRLPAKERDEAPLLVNASSTPLVTGLSWVFGWLE
jgi:hypothetical protein